MVPHARWTITSRDANETNKVDITVLFNNNQSSMTIVNCIPLHQENTHTLCFYFEKQSILFTGVDEDLYADDFRDYFDQLGIYEVSHADENGCVDEFQWTFGF